jgi:hypothetical protein
MSPYRLTVATTQVSLFITLRKQKTSSCTGNIYAKARPIQNTLHRVTTSFIEPVPMWSQPALVKNVELASSRRAGK